MKISVGRPPPNAAGMPRALEDDFAFIMQFWDCEKPTIAAVHDYCLAGAFELALACDITVAAAGTRFGEPEVRFGSGIVAMQCHGSWGRRTPRSFSSPATTRSPTSARWRSVIVNYVVPAGEEMAKAMALARDIAAAAASSVRLTERAINFSYEMMGRRLPTSRRGSIRRAHRDLQGNGPARRRHRQLRLGLYGGNPRARPHQHDRVRPCPGHTVRTLNAPSDT